MGPKRKNPHDSGSYTPSHKKERLCGLQKSPMDDKIDTDKVPNFEIPIDLTIPVDIKDELDPLCEDCAAIQANQTADNQKSAIAVSENMFLMGSLKTEGEVEEGEMETESRNISPSISDDTTGMTIGELVSQTADNYVGIEEESKPLHKDDIPLEIENTTSDKHVNFRLAEFGGIPIAMKLEPEDVCSVSGDDLVVIKAEPLMPENSGDLKQVHLTDADDTKEYVIIKDEMPEHDKLDDSLMNELSPHSLELARKSTESLLVTGADCNHSDTPDAHSSQIGTAHEVNEPAKSIDTSKMVLDPVTGLFAAADDIYDISNDEILENSQVSQIYNNEDCVIRIDKDALYSLDHQQSVPGSASGQHQCPQLAALLPTTFVGNTSTKNLLDHPEKPTKTSSSVSVSMLLAHPFFSGFWTPDQQNDILVQTIPISNNISYNPEQIFLKEFDFSRFPWLCESTEMAGFFCWSCLLFAPPEARGWSVAISSSSDLDIEEAVVDHQTTLEHLNAQTNYESKIKLARSSKKEANLEMCQKLWKRFVRTICLEKKEKGKLEFENNHNFAAEVQDTIKKIFRKNVSSDNVLELSNKILAFATHHLRNNMIEEVRNSQYVTLHLEDLSGAHDGRSWLAVIARYADRNGFVKERVIDFVRTYPARTIRRADIAIKWIKHIFTDYKLNDNVVGFSYSASVVLPNEIPIFHNIILKFCPRAMFFHSPCDNLHKSMVQAISHVPASRKYFQEAQELCNFMNKNRSLIEAVEISKGYFASAPLPKIFNAYFVTHLSAYYSTLLTIFQGIVGFKKCSPQVEQEAKKFVRFLQSFQNRILIILMGQISSTVGSLAAAIEGHFDLDRAKQQLGNSIEVLTFIRSHGFDDFYRMTQDPTLRRAVHSLNPTSFSMITNVIDSAIAFLTYRFENLELFYYTSSELLESTLKLTKYPVQSLDSLNRANLTLGELTQLKFLTTSPNTPVFIENKNHTELLNFLIQQNKTCEYSGLHKYLLFAHTISFAKTEQKQLLKSLYYFVRNRLGSNFSVKDLSQDLLCGYFWQMENHVTEKMLGDPEFYDRALQVCQFKIVVENEFDAAMVECTYFS